MSVTVTLHDGTHETHHDADVWDVTETGGLWLRPLGGGRVTAEYAPGTWRSVAKDAPKDGGDSVGCAADDDEPEHWILSHSERAQPFLLMGKRFEVTTVDYRPGNGTAVLHAKAAR